jgi:hypothetical protein
MPPRVPTVKPLPAATGMAAKDACAQPSTYEATEALPATVADAPYTTAATTRRPRTSTPPSVSSE